MTTRTYTLEYSASIARLQAELAKIPGATAKSAYAAAVKQEAIQRKSAEKVAGIWQQAMSKITFAITPSDLLAAGKAVVGFAQSMADANNALGDASTRTGVAVDTLKGLKLAAEGSGLEFANIEAALAPFPMRLAQVAKGSGDAAKAFKALGVQVTDAQGNLRDSDAVFKDIIRSIAALPTPTERSAVAMQVFGEQGGKLLQSGIASSSDALEVFIGHADRFGLETGPTATEEAARWQRAMADFNLVLEGTSSRMASTFGVGPAKALEVFTLGLVTELGLVSFGLKTLVQDLNFTQEALLMLATGKASFANVKREAEKLGRAQIEAGKATIDNIVAFYESSRAINNLGRETGDLTDDLGNNSSALWANEQAQRDAAKAAAEHAREVGRLQDQLQSIADANDIFARGDEARRDQALRGIQEQRDAVEAAGLASIETEKTFADARLRVWSDYLDKKAEAEKTATEKAQQQAADIMAAFTAAALQSSEDAAAEQARIEQGRIDTLMGGLQAAQDLADTLAERRLEKARALTAQLENQDAHLSEAHRAALASRAAAEQRAANRVFRLSQLLAIGQAGITAALAALTAIGPPPTGFGPTPLGWTAAGLATAAGAGAAIKIGTTPPPKAHRGTYADEVSATMQAGEVLVSRAGADRLGRDTLRAANEGRTPDRGAGPGGYVIQLDGETLGRVLVQARNQPRVQAAYGGRGVAGQKVRR